jgi:CBS domain-containing protein
MVDYGIHHLAVVENRHRFLGVLSSLDIVRALAESQALG